MDKPAGLPAHRNIAGQPDALSWATAYLCREGDATVPILLHRLDADTSGVLLFALTDAANRGMAEAFASRRLEKVYLALVAGDPPAAFAVDNFLRPGRRGRIEAGCAGGQAATTAFCTLSRGPNFALVEARPKTGRTHQIRVHLAGEGYPLLGDALYGGPTALAVAGRTVAVSRHLLHAWKLTLQHPISGSDLTIEAPVPADFEPFLAVRD